jgi:RimJ/RimL family protein N-acetyltransferase
MSMIETARLTIRPPVEEDRDRFAEMFTDPASAVAGGVSRR